MAFEKWKKALVKTLFVVKARDRSKPSQLKPKLILSEELQAFILSDRAKRATLVL